MASTANPEACGRLVARAAAARDMRALFAVASERLRRLVPFDAAVWMAGDPATGLPTAPTRIENMDGFSVGACLHGWELEFMEHDVNSYAALTQAPAPAGGLRAATGDRPARSPRFRRLLRTRGFADELRAVLRAGDLPWAMLALLRLEGRTPFTDDEVALVARLSAPLGAAVREHARPVAAPADGDRPGPGLLLFAPDGELRSFNDDALVWLDALGAEAAAPDTLPVGLPMAVVGTLMRARAIAAGHERGSARARIRARDGGRWLVCHASCLRGADGRAGETALVIEPATAAEMAPIVAQAYALSPREREITELISRGMRTADIARQLHLSWHTVRDHVKAIFDKMGVRSRGELVALLFGEHYAPIHLDPASVQRVASG